jgi:hypothetical protein
MPPRRYDNVIIPNRCKAAYHLKTGPHTPAGKPSSEKDAGQDSPSAARRAKSAKIVPETNFTHKASPPAGVAKRVDIVLTGRAILALHIHSISHSPLPLSPTPSRDKVRVVLGWVIGRPAQTDSATPQPERPSRCGDGLLHRLDLTTAGSGG